MEKPGLQFTIRPAQEADAPAVFRLAVCFATSFTVEEAAFRHTFIGLLADGTAFLRVAEWDGDVVGYVLGFDHETFFANGRVAWLEEIMVAEEFRARGIGRLLMASFEAWARDRQCRLISLATRRAADFYRKLDYAESALYFRKLLPGTS
jgi:GNAT superfamily N-acetyltransferase